MLCFLAFKRSGPFGPRSALETPWLWTVCFARFSGLKAGGAYAVEIHKNKLFFASLGSWMVLGQFQDPFSDTGFVR